jgi:MbtH protein
VPRAPYASSTVIAHGDAMFDDDSATFKVVLNDEEQYSIWPADRPNPPGWREAGMEGPKAACLDYIEQHWTDMRPRSLRAEMDRRAERG